MQRKSVKRKIAGLAAVAGIATSLVCATAATSQAAVTEHASASTSNAVPAVGPSNPQIYFNGAYAETLDAVNPWTAHRVSLVRGADRSATFNYWLTTSYHRDFVIVLRDYAGNEVRRWGFYNAYVVKVSSAGTEQDVDIDFGNVSDLGQ